MRGGGEKAFLRDLEKAFLRDLGLFLNRFCPRLLKLTIGVANDTLIWLSLRQTLQKATEVISKLNNDLYLLKHARLLVNPTIISFSPERRR